MIILPAIDVKDGNCVRLLKGDYATAHKVAEDAVQTAISFQQAGAKWLHMVDLDGAKDAKPVNFQTFFNVQHSCELKIEVGGGIRNMETVDFYLERGISRVILGSAAINDPAFVQQAVRQYGDQIAVGIDARDGMVAVDGWTSTSQIDYIDMAKRMESIGVKYLIFTDISRDGTLSGPNLVKLDKINRAVSCNIIASGGVSSIKDIINLDDLGVYGAICGKALYTGDLNLQSAITISKGVK
jgi:phosphoribosylformimino-5-aminoimidazole carboxamide ribotide isomerase